MSKLRKLNGEARIELNGCVMGHRSVLYCCADDVEHITASPMLRRLETDHGVSSIRLRRAHGGPSLFSAAPVLSLLSVLHGERVGPCRCVFCAATLLRTLHCALARDGFIACPATCKYAKCRRPNICTCYYTPCLICKIHSSINRVQALDGPLQSQPGDVST